MIARTLNSYFEVSAARHPLRPALNVGGRSWSYQQLRIAEDGVTASLLAHRLGGAGRTVGVLSEKSISAFSALLGIMQSGNIYVPLNPKFPVGRLARIVEDADLAALIVDDPCRSTGEYLTREGRVLLLDGSNPFHDFPAVSGGTAFPTPGGGTDGPAALLANGPTGTDSAYAYLFFTSGSTGTAKGVPVTHQNACACIEALSSRFELHSSDRFTQFSELTFDFSIGEIFLCWKAGGCLYVPSFAELMIPIDFVNRNHLTVWSSVPTLANNLKVLRALKPGRLPSIRLSLFCGEALPCQLAEAWQAAAPSSLVVNLYGPTEAAVFATSYVYNSRCPPAGEIVPIGWALPGLELQIIPETSGPFAPGNDAGELLLSGSQVVSGYWRNPSATARSFVRMPDDPSGRIWYRTGDLVTVHEKDGLLFRGRCDHQVKVRGYRVELQEIEAVLRRVTGSDLVAVVPIRRRDGRCEELIAYCNEVGGREDRIKELCKAYLPEYMLPRRILAVNEFPRNANGKIDYLALSLHAEKQTL